MTSPGPARPATAGWRAALATLAIVVGGCGGGEDSPRAASTRTTAERATSTSAPASAPSTGPAAVPEKLRFTAVAVGGGEVAGAVYAGQDVVLWFWAPW